MGELASRRNSREVVSAANSAKARMVHREFASTPYTHERMLFGNLAAHSNDCSWPGWSLWPRRRPPMSPLDSEDDSRQRPLLAPINQTRENLKAQQ
jgi:hypothetical protein